MINPANKEAQSMTNDINSNNQTPSENNQLSSMTKNKIAGQEVFIQDCKRLISKGVEAAYNATNSAMIATYWNLGKRIVEEEQNGKKRAEYGKQLMIILSEALTADFGRGFSERNIRNFRKFYLYFKNEQIWQTCLPNLTWSHYCALLRVEDEDARLWYMNEAAKCNWSVRTLSRNIGTQYYNRLLCSPKREKAVAEMKEKTKDLQLDANSLIKNPIVAEFLGFKTQDGNTEADIESSILSHIKDFLMEMGRGFAFVARQQHIVTDTQDYYIDLVFYNIELKCYVLLDLKIGTITHQDVGQMDMYVRMYDELKCKQDDNPTLGIILCSETSDDIARFSVLHDNKRLFMSKYLTCLPTKEQLKREIEKQKEIFYQQHPELDIAKEETK